MGVSVILAFLSPWHVNWNFCFTMLLQTLRAIIWTVVNFLFVFSNHSKCSWQARNPQCHFSFSFASTCLPSGRQNTRASMLCCHNFYGAQCLCASTKWSDRSSCLGPYQDVPVSVDIICTMLVGGLVYELGPASSITLRKGSANRRPISCLESQCQLLIFKSTCVVERRFEEPSTRDAICELWKRISEEENSYNTTH